MLHDDVSIVVQPEGVLVLLLLLQGTGAEGKAEGAGHVGGAAQGEGGAQTPQDTEPGPEFLERLLARQDLCTIW